MEVMHCPKPGCSYASSCHKHCVKCGTDMVAGPLRPAMNMICPACKAGDIFPENKFCGTCGHLLPIRNGKMTSTGLIIYIPPVIRKAFGQGLKVKQRVYYKWKLVSGDTLSWFTEQDSGIAQAVSFEGKPAAGGRPILIFRKVS